MVRIIETIIGLLVAFFTGDSRRQMKTMEKDIERVEKANRAAAGNAVLPTDERLRDAKKRGLYRLPGASPDDK